MTDHLPAEAPMSAVDHALLAMLAADSGDLTAHHHIAEAQHHLRKKARRDRQLVEIAALVVKGDRPRAAGLAIEHIAEFAADADLLARVAQSNPSAPGTR